MGTMDVAPGSQDRVTHRRRPFSTWVKKLANLKSSDNDRPRLSRKTKRGSKQNNPYPESGNLAPENVAESAYSVSTAPAQAGSRTAIEGDGRASMDEAHHARNGRGSNAGTFMTDNEGSQSFMAPTVGASSLAGTTRTNGGGMDSRRGGDSTFSSPAPSVRSLTTTLTTIQSIALAPGQSPGQHSAAQANGQSVQFTQPFPNQSPASALPPHLAPAANPSTYTTATANNLLTDNASILTLASSSKRRRRRSMDTDASVRAMAPSSVWGGSRESLPLSLLSANIDNSGHTSTLGVHGGPRLGAERASIYSSHGISSAAAGDRNSVYAKQTDGASIRSGIPGHVRGDSFGGSNSALATPMISARDS